MLYRYTYPCTKPTLSICYSISLPSISYPTKKPPHSPGFSSRTWVIRNSSSGWVILPDSAKSTSRKRTNLNRKAGHGRTHQKKNIQNRTIFAVCAFCRLFTISLKSTGSGTFLKGYTTRKCRIFQASCSLRVSGTTEV